MARRTTTNPEAAGNDSFLDITTNIVGILIILVMVVGERAKTAPVDIQPAGPSPEALAAADESNRLEVDVHDLSGQIADVQQELAARMNERGQLSTLITAVERELADRRAALDEQSRSHYDAQRDLALARDQLDQLGAQLRDARQAAEPTTVEIENRPTPLGKTVYNQEAHFQLTGGRVAFIPFERLLERLKSTLRESFSRMQNRADMTDTLGPLEGWRLRYVLERVGPYVQLSYLQFIPVSSQLGEPVDEALRPDSDFRRALAFLSPRTYTITIWTYPNSFAEYNQIKEALYAQGYSVAARPLPEGMPIGAAPNGSKSSAE